MNQPPGADEQAAIDAFPAMVGQYKKTSEETFVYNCLAWALGITWAWFQNDARCAGYYWPPGIERDWTVKAIRKIFARHGYNEETEDSSLEDGYLKVAIYVDENDEPSHFARQLPNGNWTSKLGNLIDIERESLECLEGADQYGRVSLRLKRKLPELATSPQ